MNPPLSDFTVPFDVAAHEALPLRRPEKCVEEIAPFDEYIRTLEDEDS